MKYPGSVDIIASLRLFGVVIPIPCASSTPLRAAAVLGIAYKQRLQHCTSKVRADCSRRFSISLRLGIADIQKKVCDRWRLRATREIELSGDRSESPYIIKPN